VIWRNGSLGLGWPDGTIHCRLTEGEAVALGIGAD
jgi:hypothetical protein